MAELIGLLSPAAMGLLLLLLKATLLLLLAGALSWSLRRVSAGLRHLVWSAAIVAVIALPVLTVASPWRLTVGLLPPPAAPAGGAMKVAGAAATPAIGTQTALAAPRPSTGSVESASGTPSTPAVPSSQGWSLGQKLLALWLLGALLVVVRLALGALVVSRVIRSATPLETPEWQRPLIEIADRLALPRLPGLFLSARLPMPFACGLFRASIVLPSEAAAWSDRRRRAVLCHELAHLRRMDLVVNTLAHCALAVYWFHPLMWVAVRRLRIESERACDDLVLGTGTRASEYADHLLEIVRSVPRRATPVAVLPLAERGEFEGRVLAILERGARREPASLRGAVTTLALGLLLVGPLAALAPVRRAGAPGDPWPALLIAPSVPHQAPGSTAPAERPVARTAQRVALPDSGRGPAPVIVPPRAPVAAADTGEGQVVRSLINALADSVAEVRENAAYSLGRLRATPAAEPLGRVVQRDPSATVREMTAWALGQIRSATAAAPLGTAVQRDTSAAVRATAVWALAQVDSPDGIPALASALRDPVTEVRGRAAWALGTLAPATAPTQLLNATADTDVGVRVRTAWALGKIGDPKAVPALSLMVQDTSAQVRDAALWALGNMDGDAAQSALVGALQARDPAMRAQAARSLSGSRGRPWPWPMPIPR